MLEYIGIGVGVIAVLAAGLFIYRKFNDNFSTGSGKIYVGKETGARYNKPEQDLSEFR